MERSAANVWELGSGYAMWNAVNSTTGAASGLATVIGYLKDSKLSDKTEKKEKVSEGGDKFTKYGSRDVLFNATNLQRSKDDITFLAQDYRGTYMCIMKELSQVAINGYYEYALIPYAYVNPDLEVSLPGGEIAYEWTVYAAPGTITVDLTTYNSKGFKATFAGSSVFSQGEYWKIIQVSA